jgi:hypothetical protein
VAMGDTYIVAVATGASREEALATLTDRLS